MGERRWKSLSTLAWYATAVGERSAPKYQYEQNKKNEHNVHNQSQ